ncbi:MAG: DegQ family serine endoprotease [Kiritimatiellia bacterium]
MKKLPLLALLIVGLPAYILAEDSIDVLRQTGRAFTTVARQTIPAVVFIQVEQIIESREQGHSFNDPFDFFGDDMLRRFFGIPQAPQQRQPRRFRREGAGSGFIISENGYILTNSHVVGDATSIRVRLHDGREFEAENIGSDPRSEVAIIKIETDNLPVVPLGDSNELEVGEWVIAVGNPFGLSETVTAGIVSALGRRNIGIADFEDFIQTDAAINPGNSGGPLLNINGEVVGINTAIYTRSGGSMGVGFAIPINMARAIKDQLIESGSVTRGYLGVYLQELTQLLAESLQLPSSDGILISDILENSPAAEAGIKQGDVVLELDGRRIPDTGAFRNEISARRPGSEITLKIQREDETIELNVVIGALPEDEAQATASLQDTMEKIGMRVGEITEEISMRLGYNLNDGVIVTELKPDAPAARVGLRAGALITGVNRNRVRSIKDFNEAIRDAIAQGRLVLTVRQGRFQQYVAVPLDQ